MKNKIVCVFLMLFIISAFVRTDISASGEYYYEGFEYSDDSELLNNCTKSGSGSIGVDSGGVSGKAIRLDTDSGKELSAGIGFALPSDADKITIEMYIKTRYYFTVGIIKGDNTSVKLIGTNSVYKNRIGYYKTNTSRLACYGETDCSVADGLSQWNRIKIEADRTKKRFKVIAPEGDFTVVGTAAVDALDEMRGLTLTACAESGKQNTLLADEIKIYETPEKDGGISMEFMTENLITENVESSELRTNTNIHNLSVIIDFGDAESVKYMLVGALYNNGVIQNAVVRDSEYIKTDNGDTERIHSGINMRGSAKSYDEIKFLLLEQGTLKPLCAAKKRREAKNGENYAEVYLGGNVSLGGFKSAESGLDTTPTVSEINGESCWVFAKNKDTQGCYMNFILGDYMKADEFDGSEYTIRVDYFDCEDGFFRICYRDTNGDFKTADRIIYTTGENVWKTAEVRINDAIFDEKCFDKDYGNPTGKGKCDFLIQTRVRSADDNSSPSSIAIKKVSVTRDKKAREVYVSAKSDEPGGAYKWYETSKVMPVTVENFSNESRSVVLKHRIKDSNENIVFSKTDAFELAVGEKTALNVDFGEIDRCDIYTYSIETITDGEYAYTTETKFAVLKTDPDGIRNSELYFAGHAERYTDTSAEEFFDVLALSNSGGYRGEFQWQGIVDESGEFLSESEMDSTVYGRTKKLIQKHNLGYIATLGCPPTNGAFTSWKDLPKTSAQLEQWTKFIGAAADYLKDATHRYELLNEPNLPGFNSDINRFWGGEYAKLARVSKQEIVKHDSAAEVGVPCVTGIEVNDADSYARGWNFYKTAIDSGLTDGTDVITVHSYPNNDGPYEGDRSTRISDLTRYVEEYKTASGGRIPKVWHTETGYSAGAMTEKNRGRLNIGMLTTIKYNRPNDIVALYNFDSKGDVGREDKYGHVYGGYEDSKMWGYNYFPKESYLMISAYNYVMANSEPIRDCDPDSLNNIGTNGKLVRAKLFKSGKFKDKSTGEYKDILVVWTSNGGKYDITLDLGTKSVIRYDEYGNGENLNGIDGTYRVNTSHYPTYFVGNFTKAECTVTE